MKKKFLALLINPFFIGYLFVYLVFLFLLRFVESFSLTEPVAMLVIVGIGFSGIALLLTKSSKPPQVSMRVTRKEILAVIICLVIITAYLTWGKDALNTILNSFIEESDFGKLVIDLILKLFFFVFIPLFIFIKYFKYSILDFGFNFKNDQNPWQRYLKIFLGMSLILLLFNYFVGHGAQSIRGGQFSAWQLLIGLPVVYLWLIIEVGLVEEFFFRALVQSHLSEYFKSEVTGIILTSLVFGLVHAPGLILRGAGTITPVGESPSILLGIGYSIVVLSVAGFFLGIIWARTKNLLLLVLIHAATDLLPNFEKLLKVFHI